MNDGQPTLEVGFAIDTHGSFGELERLQAMMNSSEATALRAAAAVERQFNGLNLGGATAQVTAFGNATTRELQNITRERNGAEKAGERMIRQLEREASTFGKSRSEIRQMNAELRATKADSAGLTELAGRIRAVSAEMDRLEQGSLRPLVPTGKLAGHQMQNLAFQFQDLGVQMVAAAQSSAPLKMGLMALMQQGSQIQGVMSQAAVGIGGVTRALGAMLLPFAPVIAAVAVAAAGVGLFVRSVEQGIDISKMVADLGLTKDEIEKLKNTSISTGDVMTAAFQVMAKNLGISMIEVKGFFGDAMDFLTTWGRRTLAGLYAAFLGTFKAIGNVVQATFSGKSLAEIGSAALDGFVSIYKEADSKLKKFGADVTAQAGANKLADLRKQAAALKADRSDKSNSAADGLQREAAATEAQIRNLYRLADAYAVSGAAAMVAEARVKAESEAIKKRGDVEAMVDRQLRLLIAQRVVDAEKGTAALRDQARIQAEVNGEVAAGIVPAERAAEIIRERIAELPLLAAIEVAQQRGLKAEVDAATAALQRQRDVQLTKRGTDLAAQFNTDAAAADRQLAMLREELRLVGATEAARARSLALLRATQEAALKFANAPQFAADAVAKQMEVYDATVAVRNAQRDLNDELNFTADKWDLIARNVQNSARGMADAFGEVGRAIGDMASIYADYRAEQARADAIHLADIKAGANVDRANAKYALATATAQIGAFGDMTDAAKGFFKEKSKGWQAVMAAEKVFRAFEFAMSVRAMVQDASETVRSVLNSGARATAAGAEGVATQAKLPFPANIAAMAATAAALVAAGIAVLGGGGASSGPSVPTAEDYQNRQGTGSVLGDVSAKSESINKSLELMMKNSNRDLEYSNEMVRSLRAIETNIGNLAAAVARETKVGGGLDASTLGLGTNTGGGLLGIGGLFSKTVTRELNDAGLQFDGAPVASVIAGGITANLYQEILKTTKKSGFLGIGGSTRTTVETVRTAADTGLTAEVSLLINSMRTAIVDAAGTIGIDGAEAMLDAFQINIGRISFKDLTSEEIEAELSAVFSRVGDDMAGAVGGGLTVFQRAGEGMLETLVRLAKEYQTVDVSLRSIGMTFGAVGLASVGARTALVDLFGGLDEFTEQTNYFRENFLSEAEQMAPIIAAVRAEMDRLGQAGIDTKDEFKSLVLGLDLSSEAGRETYAALMAVAPAFAKTSDYLASLNGELRDTAQTAEQLAAIARQRRGLEIQLMEAEGNAAAALAAKRSDELTALDGTLRALQQQIWTAQDAAQAARDLAAAQAEAERAAATLATQRRGLEIELMEATGNAAGALAARRADEIAALDASLRPLRDQILAAQDAAAAQAALATAQAEAAAAAVALAQTRRGMEIELMEALGDASGALAARRADELAGTDASLRALRQQIWAAQDAAAANALLAQAQQDAAASAVLAAQQLAAAAAQVAQQRSSLEIALLRAQGNEAGAVSAERAQQLASTEETLRALQQQVWAAEDARKAGEAAAQAQAAYAQQQQQIAQEVEQVRRRRAGMDAQLLDLLGDAAGATALRRQEELVALDASLRPLQLSIWAQEDLATAATAAADRVSAARDTLTDAYKRESDALGDTIDRFTGFGDGLRKFRAELGNGGDATIDAYRAAQARFVDASALAARGDVGALGELEAISKDFLAASRERAGSLAEYQRDVARVAGSVDRAIGASDDAVDYAQAQLEALKVSVAGLIDINKSVVSVHDAIVALQVAIAGSPTATIPEPPASATGGAAQPISIDTAALEQRIDDLSARLEVQNTAVAENTGKLYRLHERWDGGGLIVRTDDDGPLLVSSVDP